MLTGLTVTHAYLQAHEDGAACPASVGSSPDQLARGTSYCDDAFTPRRAYVYLIAARDSIAVMHTAMTPAAAPARVAVLMRLPLPLRDGLERRMAAASAPSMNGYLESLVARDLAAPANRPFEAFVERTLRRNGPRGQPAKGPRSVILLRVAPSIRELIHLRAEALGLRVNVYFESLVSQDISAAATAGEEMAFDQTA